MLGNICSSFEDEENEQNINELLSMKQDKFYYNFDDRIVFSHLNRYNPELKDEIESKESSVQDTSLELNKVLDEMTTKVSQLNIQYKKKLTNKLKNEIKEYENYKETINK
ncbi:hypothetical protein Mgra_00007092 [Meloidogyne graminicola]|uniref:Uncharacterized protein n=1 Tax=Meloidogyne graminicola TaxID=189291 RepID=A0A8S9ZJI2_9BILA|nr:hypothetical protein Mgra_00007092 [Meloidogyne graminicola]